MIFWRRGAGKPLKNEGPSDAAQCRMPDLPAAVLERLRVRLDPDGVEQTRAPNTIARRR
jgi:hypothetical protein